MRSLIALIFFCLVPSVHGSIIDIDNLDVFAHAYSIGPQISSGGVFEMGKTGSLDRITIYIYNETDINREVTVEIHDYTPGSSELKLIASSIAEIPKRASGPDDWLFDFDFTGLEFSAGEEVMFLVRGEGVKLAYGFQFLENASAVTFTTQPQRIGLHGRDFCYRTFITPVPEPSCVAIVGSAVAVYGFGFRSARRQRV